MKVTGQCFLWSTITFRGKPMVLCSQYCSWWSTIWITFQCILEKSVSCRRVMGWWEGFDGLVALEWSDLITSLWKMILLAYELFSVILWHIPLAGGALQLESLLHLSWGFFFYMYPEIQVSSCFVVSARWSYNLSSCKQMGRWALQNKVTNACWLIRTLDLNRPNFCHNVTGRR